MKTANTIIPHDWNPQEALRFCAFLDYLHDAIWRVHGRKMGAYLEEIIPPETDDIPHQ